MKIPFYLYTLALSLFLFLLSYQGVAKSRDFITNVVVIKSPYSLNTAEYTELMTCKKAKDIPCFKARQKIYLDKKDAAWSRFFSAFPEDMRAWMWLKYKEGGKRCVKLHPASKQLKCIYRAYEKAVADNGPYLSYLQGNKIDVLRAENAMRAVKYYETAWGKAGNLCKQAGGKKKDCNVYRMLPEPTEKKIPYVAPAATDTASDSKGGSGNPEVSSDQFVDVDYSNKKKPKEVRAKGGWKFGGSYSHYHPTGYLSPKTVKKIMDKEYPKPIVKPDDPVIKNLAALGLYEMLHPDFNFFKGSGSGNAKDEKQKKDAGLAPIGSGWGFNPVRCPEFVRKNNVMPCQGQYSLSHYKKTEDNAKDIIKNLFYENLRKHVIHLNATTYTAGLMLSNPAMPGSKGGKKAKERFLKAASCIDSDKKITSTLDSLSNKLTKKKTKGLTQARAYQGLAIARNANDLIDAEENLAKLEKEKKENSCNFANYSYTCGQIIMLINHYKSLARAIKSRRPFLTAKIPGTEKMFYKKLGKQKIKTIVQQAAASGKALNLYDKTITKYADANITAVKDACSDSAEDFGKNMLGNPQIMMSFLNKNPEATWIYCSEYAHKTAKKQAIDAVLNLTLMSSIVFMGPGVGLISAGVASGIIGYQFYDEHQTSTRNIMQYEAGYGDFEAYKAAKDSLKYFWLRVLRDAGLAAIGIGVEFSIFRSFARLRLLEKAGKIKIPAALKDKVMAFARSNLYERYGNVKILTMGDDEIRSLITLENSGMKPANIMLKHAPCFL